MPGFFDQKSFVTTMLQQKARKDDMYFTTLALDLTPLKIGVKIPDPPKPKDPDDVAHHDELPRDNMQDEESASDFSAGSVMKSGSDRLSQINEEKELSQSEKSDDHESDTSQKNKPKNEELFVHGLFIEGGQWSYETEALTEAQLRILNYIMPAFRLKVITKDEYSELYENDSYYAAPLYKISLREALHLDGECFIMHIPLKISDNTTPKFWLKRSTALF